MKDTVQTYEKVSAEFQRTQLILGENSISVLGAKKVILFGLGGVGSFTAEALARAGIGHLTLVDADVVDISNINRQLVALHSTVGLPKVRVMADRIRDINPACEVNTHQVFYLPENAAAFDFSAYDYVIDAIDTVSAKLALIENANAAGTPILCALGTGNKLDPFAFEICDLYQTSVCPLARVMRHECKKRGISSVKVLYSKEKPITPAGGTIGSVSFVPSVAGLMIAGSVIKDLCGI